MWFACFAIRFSVDAEHSSTNDKYLVKKQAIWIKGVEECS